MKQHEVLSYSAVALSLKIPIRKVEELVKRSLLVGIRSKVFMIPAITKKSFLKYTERKDTSENKETMNIKEVKDFLGFGSIKTVHSTASRGAIVRVGNSKYCRKSVMKYKKERDSK